jgi:hypothetical protein
MLIRNITTRTVVCQQHACGEDGPNGTSNIFRRSIGSNMMSAKTFISVAQSVITHHYVSRPKNYSILVMLAL